MLHTSVCLYKRMKVETTHAMKSIDNIHIIITGYKKTILPLIHLPSTTLYCSTPSIYSKHMTSLIDSINSTHLLVIGEIANQLIFSLTLQFHLD